VNPDYPDVVGLSVLCLPGADVLRPLHRNVVRHGRVGHATVDQITTALQRIGYDMVLDSTPDLPDVPDHHQLAVAQAGGYHVVGHRMQKVTTWKGAGGVPGLSRERDVSRRCDEGEECQGRRRYEHTPSRDAWRTWHARLVPKPMGRPRKEDR
jgi:hypothetical protein